MNMSEIIRTISVGNSVAEFDEALDKYFVETEAFRSLINGRVDVIAGDKGTGKTALFRILQSRYRQIPELKDVEIITAFNPVGNPIFQNLTQESPLTEGQYRSIWKAFFLSLVGNWALEIEENRGAGIYKKLDEILKNAGLRIDNDSPTTIFNKITSWIRKFLNPESSETELTFSETGIPILKQKFNLGNAASNATEEVSYEEALSICNKCIEALGVKVWVVLDRLDESFQGHPNVEIPALRALLRTYLDLLEFENIKIKLFVRCDLFRKVTTGGFVNLTHINAKKIEIVWDEDDLLNLLCGRIKESTDFIKYIDISGIPNIEIFKIVFPEQVDIGERKPTSWNWIMSRIRDGKNIKPPRNLIDLVSLSKEAQLRREERESREYSTATPLIESDSIKRAMSILSKRRVEDTLFAEAGEYVSLIHKFEGQKSEHNLSSLGALLEKGGEHLGLSIKHLEEIGFLEKIGQSYKVPMLYREGLSIIQGKAFNL